MNRVMQYGGVYRCVLYESCSMVLCTGVCCMNHGMQYGGVCRCVLYESCDAVCWCVQKVSIDNLAMGTSEFSIRQCCEAVGPVSVSCLA